MKYYTHENHFVYGFNDVPYSFRKNDDDKWFVNYGKAAHRIESFRAECGNAARLIRDCKQGPLWIMLSGGSDSECAMRSFVDARIPVRALIVRFKGDLNIHDISYAVIAAESLGVPYKIVDLDILKFVETQGYDICKRIQSGWLSMALVCWAMSQVDGVPIVGNGDCFLHIKRDNNYYMSEREAVVGLYRYLQLENRDGVPGFLQYTPEQMLSYLQHPITRNFVRDKPIVHNERAKIQIYVEQFGMHHRTKYTGYEKFAREKYSVESKFPIVNEVAWTEYSALLNLLRA